MCTHAQVELFSFLPQLRQECSEMVSKEEHSENPSFKGVLAFLEAIAEIAVQDALEMCDTAPHNSIVVRLMGLQEFKAERARYVLERTSGVRRDDACLQLSRPAAIVIQRATPGA